jgi:hypothetical protein
MTHVMVALLALWMLRRALKAGRRGDERRAYRRWLDGD